MGTTRIVALLALGFVLVSPRLAPAATCHTGCGFGSGGCVKASAVDKIGCGTICKQQWKDDRAACAIAGTGCEVEREAYHTCRNNCVDTGRADHAQCLSDRAACDASCDAETDALCASGCGATNPTSYKACVLPITSALPGCRSGCNHDGGCIRGCAATARGQLSSCKSAFDTCLGGCL